VPAKAAWLASLQQLLDQIQNTCRTTDTFIQVDSSRVLGCEEGLLLLASEIASIPQ
jgi:hypothetical protein